MAVLGTVGFRYIGVYDATKEYVTGNVVTYDGSSYVMIKYASDGVSKTAVTGVAPDADDTTWKIMAEGISESKADAKLKEAVSTAEASAKKWAVGNDESITEGSDTDNAKAYAEQAKEAAEKASAVSGVGIATATKAGIVKVDDDTIKVDADGTLRGAMKVTVATTEAVGTVKPDGDTITIDEDGTIHGASKEAVDTINIIIETLKTEGATRANALPIEKDLGASFTAEQSEDIRAGRFDKVRVGGYWTINGHKYWAGHADYRLHCGDTELTTHHMLVFPDKTLYNGVMNDTNDTTGAYYGSKMKTSGLADALATVKADFGANHVLTHQNLLANSVSGDSSSSWGWYDSQIDLMNECMVYGHQAWGAAAHDGYDTGCDKTQIALFQARPDLICNRQYWWLRDVSSAPSFCCVTGSGSVGTTGAVDSIGVRPAFLIY